MAQQHMRQQNRGAVKRPGNLEGKRGAPEITVRRGKRNVSAVRRGVYLGESARNVPAHQPVKTAGAALPGAGKRFSARIEKTVRPKKKTVYRMPGPLDVTFLVFVLIILAVGLLVLFSASYPRAFAETGDSFYYISRQVVFAGLGLVGMWLVSLLPFQIYHRFAMLLYLGTVGLLVAVLLIPSREDAKRWIDLGFITFQPSEVAKFAIIVLFAHLVSRYHEKMKNPRYGLLPFMGALGVVAVLMLLEPHLSGTILIMGIGVTMMFIGGTDLRWFALAGILALAAVAVVVLIPDVVPYAWTRIENWLDPWSSPLETGYQTIQSLYAIGSGGLFGVGFGNSRQKYLYLPEVQNDFVFSVLCEELGFVGASIVIMLFVLLIWRGYLIAMRCKDRFGSMLVVGIITQVGLQTVLNIAVVSNTVPNTGISLPFFSYGGTSLVMLLLQMGVVLSVSRQSVLEKTS